MKVEFTTIDKFGKYTIEMTDEGNDRFDIIMFKDNAIMNQINVTKENVESMMSFINRKTKGVAK